MLERSGLLFGPWTMASPVGTARARPVSDLVTGAPLGLVRQAAGRWRVVGWLAGQVLQVCETEDESLLCTVRRGWGPLAGWQVYDAEEHRVALVRRWLVVDGLGRRLALVEPSPGEMTGRFASPDHQELAAFSVKEGHVALTFGPLLEHDPLTKMALLGAFLGITVSASR